MVYQTLFKVPLCHITFEYFENLCEGICLYGATGRRCETNYCIVINYVVISYIWSLSSGCPSLYHLWFFSSGCLRAIRKFSSRNNFISRALGESFIIAGVFQEFQEMYEPCQCLSIFVFFCDPKGRVFTPFIVDKV